MDEDEIRALLRTVKGPRLTTPMPRGFAQLDAEDLHAKAGDEIKAVVAHLRAHGGQPRRIPLDRGRATGPRPILKVWIVPSSAL